MQKLCNGIFLILTGIGLSACDQWGHASFVDVAAKETKTESPSTVASPAPTFAPATAADLSGDAEGPLTANRIVRVGGLDAGLVAQGAQLAQQATSLAEGNTIVRRDTNGAFRGDLIGSATSAGSATLAQSALAADRAQTALTADSAAHAESAKAALSVSGVVPVANGGTGAHDVEGALKNLGLDKMRLDSVLRVNTLGELPANALAGQLAYVKANFCAYELSGLQWEVVFCTYFPRLERAGAQQIQFLDGNDTARVVSFAISANGVVDRHYFFGVDYAGASSSNNLVSVQGNGPARDPATVQKIHGQWQRCGYALFGRNVCLPLVGTILDTLTNEFDLELPSPQPPDPDVSPAPPPSYLAGAACPAGAVVTGFDPNGQIVCQRVAKAMVNRVRTVTGSILDAQHQIAEAACENDETVIGGYCQCHDGAAWISGIAGNGYRCACTGPAPLVMTTLAYCIR